MPLRATLHVLLLALCLFHASGGSAQNAPPVAMNPGWERLASRAEQVLQEGGSSERVLTQLRSELTEARAGFLDAQNVNSARIDTLQRQLGALGPVPGSDEAQESEAIAERRSELEAQLGQLQAPRRRAEEAYSRADGLIGEIDATLREREAARLMSRGPWPLNPVLWPGALADLRNSLAGFAAEIAAGVETSAQRDALRDRLPDVLLYLAVAAVLLLRGRHLIERLTVAIYSRGRYRGVDTSGFIVSLGQVIVPTLGAAALAEAAFASGVLGPRGQLLAQSLASLAFILFGSVWLGARVFPHRDEMPAPFVLDAQSRRRGRWLAALMGVALVLRFIVRRLAEFDDYSVATNAVLGLPAVLLAAFCLILIGRILWMRPQTAADDGEIDRGFLDRAVSLLGRMVSLAGGAGIVLALLGFGNAAVALVFPTVTSLGLLALLAILHLLIRDIYALVRRQSVDAAGEALLPVLLTFALSIGSLPLFALLWGVRSTDLVELWARFRQGFAVGDTRISPDDFVTFALVFAIGYILTRLVQGTLKGSVLPRTRMDKGGRNAVTAGIGYAGIFLAAVFAVTAAGIDLSSLAIVAGALSVGIGFGLQTIVSNFVSGIILLIERPISEGDWIEVGDNMGYVRDISVRSTRIETFDRTDVIVPNADFVSGVVTNWTRGNLVGRVIVPVTVTYEADSQTVERLLRDVAEAHPMVVLNPAPAILFRAFGPNGMEFEIRAILRDVNFVLDVQSDMNHEIARLFAENGIEIPVTRQDVRLRSEGSPVASRSGARATSPEEDEADLGPRVSGGDGY